MSDRPNGKNVSSNYDGQRNCMGAMGLVLLSLSVAACGSLTRNPVPKDLADTASIVGSAKVRFWGDAAPPDLRALKKRMAESVRARFGRRSYRQGPISVEYLAISGGSDDGAYGAGLLVGWSAAGTRPEFQVVTGVSTGAIIAPFAFLGPRYDQQLREAYTNTSSRKIFEPRLLAGLIQGSSLASTAPLRQLIQKYVTKQMLREIAKAHLNGRRLLIGTTNLDAGRPVIWDIGALANSSHPRALELFRKIIRASAAIPAVFPPVQFEVEADGKRFDELHADGGVSASVFLYPAQITTGNYLTGLRFKRRLYVIRNSKVRPDYAPGVRGLVSITRRSLTTLISSSGTGDLYRIYLISIRDGIDYNLAQIPQSFTGQSARPFDVKYMRALFDVGYRRARSGYPWSKRPPGYGIQSRTVVRLNPSQALSGPRHSR